VLVFVVWVWLVKVECVEAIVITPPLRSKTRLHSISGNYQKPVKLSVYKPVINYLSADDILSLIHLT
jgi:hypothetical protein